MSIIEKGNAITIQGDNLNCDICNGWYLGMDELPPEEIAKTFMSGIDPEISKTAKAGDILVCGKNFGYGKVHGVMWVAMRKIGITCIIAESFSTQIFQKAQIIGMHLVECPGALEKISMGDLLEADVENSIIKNLTKGSVIHGVKFPSFALEVMKAGGQSAYLEKRIKEGNIS